GWDGGAWVPTCLCTPEESRLRSGVGLTLRQMTSTKPRPRSAFPFEPQRCPRREQSAPCPDYCDGPTVYRPCRRSHTCDGRVGPGRTPHRENSSQRNPKGREV